MAAVTPSSTEPAGESFSMRGISRRTRSSSEFGSHRSRLGSFSLGPEIEFGIPSRRISENDDEEELKWAALEKLPTYDRIRTTIVEKVRGSKRYREEVDLRLLLEQDPTTRDFVQNLFAVGSPHDDNEKFLRKLRGRLDRVGLQLPTVEVRYENFSVEAETHIGSQALPSLPNGFINGVESVLTWFGISVAKKTKICILSESVELSSLGGTLCYSALLDPGRQRSFTATAIRTEISKLSTTVLWAGNMSEFVPQKTSAYITQEDVHMPEMTVRETLMYSAKSQGVGTRYELLTELLKREEELGIYPDVDIDFYLKATALRDIARSIVTEYTMKILGIEVCSDIIIGNEMIRGISGGQKKRVTTGEMIVGPTRTLFMDEISTGLDSSTTYQIVKCVDDICHSLDTTVVMSLLQPPPETYELFDILLAVGQIIYHGDRNNVLRFFEMCGFKCPERKSVADFLQEVTSGNDQVMSTYFRPEMPRNNLEDGELYASALFFGVTMTTFIGFADLVVTAARLPVFYKQRDLLSFPAWAFVLPRVILSIPVSLYESTLWVVFTYYTIGFVPAASRFFQQFLMFFALHDMVSSCLRFIPSVARDLAMGNSLGTAILLIFFLISGFFIPRAEITPWWIWGYWISPFSYVENAISVLEFRAPQWDKVSTRSNETLGVTVLKSFGFFTGESWYWIGVGVLLGYSVLFNVLFSLALTYLNPLKENRSMRVSEQNEAADSSTRTGPESVSLPPRFSSRGQGNDRQNAKLSNEIKKAQYMGPVSDLLWHTFQLLD
ncbi:hypothetical protein R1sor_025393 [Riccia sorocarpa]|uniref:ABC transporter domain-containing protein n=1 Tax=Riccia sorocarpa TaxID=122646 RepID=A0ABD3GBR5_9MARC